MLNINDLKLALVNVDAYLLAKENSGVSFFLCNLEVASEGDASWDQTANRKSSLKRNYFTIKVIMNGCSPSVVILSLIIPISLIIFVIYSSGIPTVLIMYLIS